MGYMEKLAAEKKAVKALYDKGMENLTDDEATELKNRFEEAKRLQERVDLFKGVNDLNVDEAKPQAATDTHVAGTGTAGTGYAPVVTQVDMDGVWPYERPLVVADLFGSVTLSGNANTVEYPVYGALEGGAGTVGEGGAKPQTHLPAPRWESDSLKEVAAWWKVTDNMAEDLSYIVSEINNHARYNLQLLEETQLLSGDGTSANVKGLLTRDIQTMAQADDSDPDRIFKARTKIAVATGFRADAIVINPADYEAIRLSKDANGQYYGGGYFNGQYGNGTIMQDPPLWGLKTVVTEAIAQGTVLVGAPSPPTRIPMISRTISSRSACANASACRSSIRRLSSRCPSARPESEANRETVSADRRIQGQGGCFDVHRGRALRGRQRQSGERHRRLHFHAVCASRCR